MKNSDVLTEQDIIAGIPLWSRSFVDWSESLYGFYVDQHWDVERKRWVQEKAPITWPERQRRALQYLFTLDDEGQLPFLDIYWFDIGKSAKTLLQAALGQWAGMFHERNAEILFNANSEEQGAGRAFTTLRNSILWNPYNSYFLEDDKVKRIEFRYTGNIARPNPRAAGSQAGINPAYIAFDEIWDYTSDSDQAHFEEQKPSPTRNFSMRFVGSYPPYQGEKGPANAVLDAMFDSSDQPKDHVELVEGLEDLPLFTMGTICCWWNHDPYPWHTPHFLERQQNDPGVTNEAYLRIWEARRVNRETSFMPADRWDSCEDSSLIPISDTSWGQPMVLGVDVGVNYDTGAVIARTWDAATQRMTLLKHRIFRPSDYQGEHAGNIILDMKQYVLDLHRRHDVLAVYYDFYQFESSAAELERDGVKMVKVSQNSDRIRADTAYRGFIISGVLRNYPQSRDLRDHVLQAVAVQRGEDAIRMDKRKASHKIDAAVADSMCCLGVTEYKALFEQRRRARLNPPKPTERRGRSSVWQQAFRTGRN